MLQWSLFPTKVRSHDKILMVPIDPTLQPSNKHSRWQVHKCWPHHTALHYIGSLDVHSNFEHVKNLNDLVIQLKDTAVTPPWHISLMVAKLGLLLWFGNWIPIWNFQIGDKFLIWVEKVFLESKKNLEPKWELFSKSGKKSLIWVVWWSTCFQIRFASRGAIWLSNWVSFVTSVTLKKYA